MIYGIEQEFFIIKLNFQYRYENYCLNNKLFFFVFLKIFLEYDINFVFYIFKRLDVLEINVMLCFFYFKKMSMISFTCLFNVKFII